MYTIKQLADMVGVTPKAIRVYEKKKLLLPVDRSEAGYRLYNKKSLATLEKICRLKQYEFTLAEISQLLNLSDELLNKKLKRQIGRLLADADRHKLLAVDLNDNILFDTEDETRSALLVINMQNDFTYGCLGFGKAKALISPIAQFIAYARSASIPVIFVNDCHDENDKKEFYIWGKHAEQGSEGAKVCSELNVSGIDYLINKHYYSGFFNTDLLDLLNRLQVNHVYIVGLDSNICVYHTVADAFNYGFRTTLLTDLTVAQYMSDYHSSLTFMHGNFLTELKDSAKEHFNP